MSDLRKRILLAEDDAGLCDFISKNLQARGFDVIETNNGREAIAEWKKEEPHLLILDIMMPVMDGLEVCRLVRALSDIPIIVLTAMDAEADKVIALDLGADDYLTKPFGIEELLARVRAILRRTEHKPQPTGERHFGDITIDSGARIVKLRGSEVRLTPMEFALLVELTTNLGKVMSHRSLLQSIWGPEYGDEAEYLRVYINRLRHKLETNPSAPAYLLTVSKIGYRFVIP